MPAAISPVKRTSLYFIFQLYASISLNERPPNLASRRAVMDAASASYFTDYFAISKAMIDMLSRCRLIRRATTYGRHSIATAEAMPDTPFTLPVSRPTTCRHATVI